MRKIRSGLLLFASLWTSSCVGDFESKDLYGKYVPKGYIHSFDTLELKSQGDYSRNIYDANHHLVVNTIGHWELVEGHKLKLETFYLNLDQDLEKFPVSVKDSEIEVITDVGTMEGTISFCVGSYIDENCYQKID
jgi:hypothetical protein